MSLAKHLRRAALPAMLLAGISVSAETGKTPAKIIGRVPVHKFASISGMTATPGTVVFSATDPDLGSVTGTAATVTWNALLGLPTNTWTLTAQAGFGTFTSCATVPVSAVTVTCTAAAATGIGGSGACASGFALSTTAQQVASGAEGTLSGSYTVNISFTLADRWKYVAALSPACSLTITYSANTP